jgi:hypothetical protein
MTVSSIFPGLTVKPSTKYDLDLLKNYFDNSDFYAEYDSEFNCFLLPNDPETNDELERELTEIFNDFGASVTFETIIL